MKKRQSFILAILLSFFLVGCLSHNSGISHPLKSAPPVQPSSDSVINIPENHQSISEPVEITVGYIEDFSGTFSQILDAFNHSQDQVIVHHKAYADMEKLTLDMLTADGPDMICTQSILHQMEIYAAKGFLLPITDFLCHDFQNDLYFTNVLQAGMDDGEIYFFTPFYRISAYAAPTAVVGNMERITTLEEFQTVFADVPPEMLYCAMIQTNILSLFMCEGSDTFIDYDTNTANFDTEAFRNILEYCGRFAATPEECDLETCNVFFNSNIYSAEYLQKRASARERYTPYGSEITYMSAPFTTHEGLAIRGEYYMGISSQTDQPEAVKELMRFFLTEEIQMMGQYDYLGLLPILRSARKAYDDTWPEMIEYDKTLVSLIERTDHYIDSYYPPVLDIILDEASYFFSGIHTAEKTAALIQDRVTLYLTEKG